MNRIAKFEKVSFEQFKKDWQNILGEQNFTDDKIPDIYNNINLPKRATKQSAGYDFFIPAYIVIGKGGAVNIPTGIKCKMDSGWVLQIYPRSGQSFKYGLHLANTVGIIDADYYGNVSNEGHIFVRLVNDSALAAEIILKEGTAFCQGVFIPFGTAENDDVSEYRTGGLGSTYNN